MKMNDVQLWANEHGITVWVNRNFGFHLCDLSQKVIAHPEASEEMRAYAQSFLDQHPKLVARFEIEKPGAQSQSQQVEK